jgi:hypothetical protein
MSSWTMNNSMSQALFVISAFLIQALLLADFAARNWRPSLEREYGWIVYVTGILGLVLGVLFLAAGQPWYVVAAPWAYFVWAAYGYYVDVFRRIKWRSPRQWSVFVPYVGLFIASQFAFWVPLWYMSLAYWGMYAVMYSLNTGLNIYSHRKMSKLPC